MFQEAWFQDPNAAREKLEELLWPEGPVCPHCGCTGNITKLTIRRRPDAGVHKCNDCRKEFTVTVGTVFERSHIKLHLWLQVAYLMNASKKGISSHQIHRMIGVTYKTAWFMTMRLREAMDEGSLVFPLGGEGETVEVDETYFGTAKDKPRNQRGGHHLNKIVSLVERNGDARSFHVQRVNGATLKPILLAHIAENTRVMTDEAGWYNWVGKHFEHDFVNHRSYEYSRGDVTTNTVEGFFATMKRGLIGTFHHVSTGHLDAYLNEFDFRYNFRDKSDWERTQLALKGIVGKRLTYHDC